MKEKARVVVVQIVRYVDGTEQAVGEERQYHLPDADVNQTEKVLRGSGFERVDFINDLLDRDEARRRSESVD